MRSSKLIGMTVYDNHGQAVGTIEDILVRKGGPSSRTLSCPSAAM
jgi:sporulation protein YlmC with PRC-barrel domain